MQHSIFRFVCVLLLAVVPSTTAADPESVFLVSYGGFSFYKVKIEPATWAAFPGQLITDDVISQTCIAATRGPMPQAPCASSSAVCQFYTPTLCVPTSEAGCDQPLQSTAVALGCSSPADIKCGTSTLVGTKKGGLWSHMGGKWGGHACGNHPFQTTGCANGNAYQVDGRRWADPCPTPACALVSYDCNAGVADCTSVAAPAMEHWAFCVGKVACRCVNGDCSISSDLGYCVFGSCRPGFSGPLCNEVCSSTFCLGRNDPTKPNNGVRTTTLNLCECDCLPEYGPSGTGPAGTRCATCILPGSNKCTAYTGIVLASPTQLTTVARGAQFSVTVESRFGTNQVDVSVSEIILVTLNPGGGNGDGGQLTVHNQIRAMSLGRVTFILSFSAACRACMLTFKDVSGKLQALVFGPIAVSSAATHMMLQSAPTIARRGETFVLTVSADDGVAGTAGNRDYRINEIITASIRTVPAGGNGNGGALNFAAPTTSVSQPFVDGLATWYLNFGRACLACVIVLTPGSSALPILALPPLQVVTIASRFMIADANIFPTSVRRLAAFDVTVMAVDDKDDQDTTRGHFITASLVTGGGNGDGGELTNTAQSTSLTQRLVNGAFRFTFTFTQACRSCIIKILDNNVPALNPLTLPSIRVTSAATRLVISSTTPTEAKMGDQIQFTVRALDAAGNVDEMYGEKVTATLLPNGGNGDGGILIAKPLPDLIQNMVNGTYTYYISFTQACTACIIEFSDNARLLAKAPTQPIFVSTERVRLALKTPLPLFINRNNGIEITVLSLDVNGNIDIKDTSRVTLSLQSGGGNGDGGSLSDVRGLQRQLVAGQVTFTPSLSKACTLCVLQIAHEATSIPTLKLPGIEVRTFATRLIFTEPPPKTVARKTPFRMIVKAVDEQGGVDTSDQGVMTLRLRLGGGNGAGGDLRSDGTVAALSKLLVGGAGTWFPEFSRACDACILEIVDATGRMITLVSDPILVSTMGTRLGSETPWTKSSGVAFIVPRGNTYSLDVRVMDDDGSIDTQSTAVVTVGLNANGGNGDGQPLTNDPVGMSQPMKNGRVIFYLSHGKPCDSCFLTLSANSLVGLTLPAVRVTTTGIRIASKKPWPTAIAKGTSFDVQLQVVDDLNFIDRSYVKQISLTLGRNGGNGDGGELLNTLPPGSLVQIAKEGETNFRVALSKSCAACVVTVADLSGTMMALAMAPLLVSTMTAAINTRAVPERTVRGTPFVLEVRALDTDGNINTEDSSDVVVQLADQTADGALINVGVLRLTNSGGTTLLRQRLDKGRVLYNLVVDSECTKCTITTDYYGSGANALNQMARSVYALPSHGVASTLPPGVTAAPRTPPVPGQVPPPPGPPVVIVITPNPILGMMATNTPSGSDSGSGVDYSLIGWIALALGLVIIIAIAAFCGYRFYRRRATAAQVPMPIHFQLEAPKALPPAQVAPPPPPPPPPPPTFITMGAAPSMTRPRAQLPQASPVSEQPKLCGVCGMSVRPTSNFCPACGNATSFNRSTSDVVASTPWSTPGSGRGGNTPNPIRSTFPTYNDHRNVVNL